MCWCAAKKLLTHSLLTDRQTNNDNYISSLVEVRTSNNLNNLCWTAVFQVKLSQLVPPWFSACCGRGPLGTSGPGLFYRPDVLRITWHIMSKHWRKHKALTLTTAMTSLWLPYVIGQAIIFSSCGFFFLLFFPRLISAVTDWMSTILPHMTWPYCEFRMQV